MAWQGLEGHDDVVEQFHRALVRGRLASTFLFVGPAGVGKRAFAQRLAKALLCPNVPAESLAPCGTCDSCVQVDSGVHPDLYLIAKPADRSSIPIQLLVGDDAHRMREGLCHDLALKPFMGGRKVAIIDDADDLNEEGANCLLKTLEEPPPHSVLILIGTSPDKQLPTIRSRCQVVRFRPLPADTLAEILVARGLIADPAEAERIAPFADGSLERALQLADEQLWSFREELFRMLAAVPLDSVALAQSLGALVDAAGKEAGARRARARQCIAFAVDFYRQWLRAQLGLPMNGETQLVRAVEQIRRAHADEPLTAIHCIDRSLAALAHVDRNAHQATNLECWCDDLARIIESGQPAAFAADS
jgi:DNA polymerase III subunit delta'